MANVAFTKFYDQVLPYLPGAELGIVKSQIRKTIREFMKRTTLFREAFVFLTVVDIHTYKLNPTFGQVSSIINVFYGERELPPYPEDARRIVSAGAPRGWFTSVPDYITLYPVPDAEYEVYVQAVVTLDQLTEVFPEEIFEQYAEPVAAGVLAAMMGMPGKPWTQSTAARESGRIFASAIRTIRGSLRDGGQPNQSTFRGIARFGA